jgi:hypothetical protein
MQFIRTYENALSDEMCDEIMEYFEYEERTGYDPKIAPMPVIQHSKDIPNFDPGMGLKRKDSAIFLQATNMGLANIVNEALVPCIKDYFDNYEILLSCQMIESNTVKVQKTAPGGHYSAWHCEEDKDTGRVLVWILYLNDVAEGEGETEFIYQGHRQQPKKGTLVVWPAGFTHTHRGNPVYSQTKYVATGWLTWCKEYPQG